MATDKNNIEAHGPLHQFEINEIVPIEFFDINISFTNSSLWMIISVILSSFILIFGVRKGSLEPSRWQVLVEMSYEFIANMIRDNVGSSGRPYFPFIFTLFIFILFGNVLGMVPYSFTYTSHIAVTFFMAFIVFMGVTFIGIFKRLCRTF